ncbi:sigma-70 family RNA polymerase sigma factor [Streptomyces sp. PTM05]|uniref:RNA polymerase sigma factor n=1 Tax=Streptantibioticus parmotrematis TaxID=2873249 RepID=A0ABS7QWA4_9ACTN|nr:sigma-70 family RNA polymerase sigma factor [Streptantibioticus parmotrematis]MBY8886981.1 sigma-70 family RNA polymerase sigma factor [Streptantibioticus parmotrematis]
MTGTTAEADPITSTGTQHADEKMRTLYDMHAGSLLRTLMGWTEGDRQTAEDLVQETMLRAWRNLHTLHDDPRTVRPWLLTVARRLAIDALRARSARPTEVEDEPLTRIPTTTQPLEQILDRHILRDALTHLSPTHRTVLIEIYVLNQPVRQTAQRLGIPEGTVKSRTYHALRALRDTLHNQHTHHLTTTHRVA